MREKDLEKKLIAAIKKRGMLCLKWVSPGYTGVPDRIIIGKDGKIVFVELKRPGVSAAARSARQKRVAEILKGLGHTVVCLSEEEGIDDILQAL